MDLRHHHFMNQEYVVNLLANRLSSVFLLTMKHFKKENRQLKSDKVAYLTDSELFNEGYFFYNN